MAKKRAKRRYTFGRGSFNVIFDELVESHTFRALSATEKLVLIDMIRVFQKASKGDTESVTGGFIFTWSHCKVDVSEKKFYKCRRRILRLGFFRAIGENQNGRLGISTRFNSFDKWATAERLAPDEKQRLLELDEAKRGALKRGRDRKVDYLTRPKKTERAIGQGYRRASGQGYGSTQSDATGPQVRDRATENAPSHRASGQGYISTISGTTPRSIPNDSQLMSGLVTILRASPLAVCSQVRRFIESDLAFTATRNRKNGIDELRAAAQSAKR